MLPLSDLLIRESTFLEELPTFCSGHFSQLKKQLLVYLSMFWLCEVTSCNAAAHLHRKTLVFSFELIDLLAHDVQLLLGELELVLKVVLSLERVLKIVHDLRYVAPCGRSLRRLRWGWRSITNKEYSSSNSCVVQLLPCLWKRRRSIWKQRNFFWSHPAVR